MHLKQIMEENCEPRIRNIQVKKDLNRLWITLWEDFSLLTPNLYRCFNMWVKNLKRKFGNRFIYIEKIDFKVDSYGSFCEANYENLNNKLLRCLSEACDRLNSLDHGFEDNIGEWISDASNPDLQYTALQGFQNT